MTDGSRLLKVDGPLTDHAGERLAADLRELISRSSAAITIHISSSGGKVQPFYDVVEVLWPMSGPSPCHVTTIGHYAVSAAAYLLIAGHRAYAVEGSTIGMHGVRQQIQKRRLALTGERALSIAIQLDRENRKVAKRLARAAAPRLVSKYAAMLSHDPEVAGDNGPPVVVQRFARYLGEQVEGFAAARVLDEAAERFVLVHHLVVGAASKPRTTGYSAEVEHAMLNAALTFEPPSGEWPLDPVRVLGVTMDYALARDLVRGGRADVPDSLRRHCQRLGMNTVNGASGGPSTDLALAFWCFALTMSYRLLLGESMISAADACWLGLVDGVVADPAGPQF